MLGRCPHGHVARTFGPDDGVAARLRTSTCNPLEMGRAEMAQRL
jgi:hypothetical protein